MDFLPCFWKSLKDEALTVSDLKEADYLTYKLTSEIMEVNNIEKLKSILDFMGRGGTNEVEEERENGTASRPSKKHFFIYTTLNGIETELLPGGKEMEVQ